MTKNEFKKNWYIKKASTFGRGIFANREVMKDEIIDILTGKVVDLTEIVYWPYNNAHYNWWQIGKTAWLQTEPPGEFINHSCNPSAVILNLVQLIAARDIEQGEEITVDYDAIDWDEHILPMKCLCGYENCRKIIKGYKFLPDEIKMRYKQIGIIPEYIFELERDWQKQSAIEHNLAVE